MKIFKNMKMRTKLLTYLLIFSFILLGFLWLFQIVFLDNFYKGIKTKELKANTKVLLNSESIEDLYSEAEDISLRYGVHIKLIDDGNIIDYPAHGGLEPFYEKEEENTGSGEYPFVRREFPPMESRGRRNTPIDILEFSDTLEIEDREIEIFIQSMISPVDATVNTLKVQLYIITIIMILISIILSIFITNTLSKPISGINESAKELIKGNYKVKFYEEGYKEINELSTTMNKTAIELDKVDNLRKELLSNITHDLRTPLTLIEGYGEAMRDLPGENTPENAQIIIDEAKKLNKLVSDSMDISAFESGMIEIKRKKFNLTKSIENDIKQTLDLLINNIDIEFKYDREIEIVGDEDMIIRAFDNLLHNGINYNKNDDRIIVCQEVEKDFVKISVIDNGEGIKEKEIAYIWDRYYRTNKDHKRPIIGTGLGLSIVKSVINRHNGEYGVSSVYGKGSIFWFKLPL